MITVAFVGRHVLPRIRSLLHKDIGKVNFIGDALQFLSVDERQIPGIRGATYEIVLPYGETYYQSVFRSGIHVESVCYTRKTPSPFGSGRLNPEQVYLRYQLEDTRWDVPMLLPLVHSAKWKEAYLTPAAFPLWYIAGNTMEINPNLNFAKVLHDTIKASDNQAQVPIEVFNSKYEA